MMSSSRVTRISETPRYIPHVPVRRFPRGIHAFGRLQVEFRCDFGFGAR